MREKGEEVVDDLEGSVASINRRVDEIAADAIALVGSGSDHRSDLSSQTGKAAKGRNRIGVVTARFASAAKQ